MDRFKTEVIGLDFANHNPDRSAIPFEGEGHVEPKGQVELLEIALINLNLDRRFVPRAIDNAGEFAFSAKRAVFLAERGSRFGHENQWGCHFGDSYFRIQQKARPTPRWFQS
jgi:hypothetical protein